MSSLLRKVSTVPRGLYVRWAAMHRIVPLNVPSCVSNAKCVASGCCPSLHGSARRTCLYFFTSEARPAGTLLSSGESHTSTPSPPPEALASLKLRWTCSAIGRPFPYVTMSVSALAAFAFLLPLPLLLLAGMLLCVYSMTSSNVVCSLLLVYANSHGTCLSTASRMFSSSVQSTNMTTRPLFAWAKAYRIPRA